jgi:hypothetical protein
VRIVPTSQSPADASATGDRPSILGKYELLEEVGHGAVGVVYRARDNLSGQEVAVKVFAPTSPAQQDIYERLFFNEVRANGLLRHPNIVPVLDAGQEGNRYYVVMEYVPGVHTLEPFCQSRRLLPIKRVLEIVIDCAEALHYAHGKGVIHRDIKPANVLINDGYGARLSDFGIAVLGEGQLAETATFASAGSPLYMAPEQVRHDMVTPSTDLFALGVVTYELLSGRHPFSGRSIAAVTERLLHHEPTPLSDLRSDLPFGLSELIVETLAKTASGRPSNGLEFARRLSDLFGDDRRPLEGIITEGRADQLRELDFFRGFGDAELWELLRWAHWEDVAVDEAIVREGEEGASFFILVEGLMQVRKANVNVARLASGACLGEISYLSSQPRSATVMAISPCSVLRINGQLLQRASERCQLAFQNAFIRTLIARLVATTTALANRD